MDERRSARGRRALALLAGERDQPARQQPARQLCGR
jgi:hypothetical protein